MRDQALQAAGALAILVALAHGAIGELQIFPRARIDPQRTRALVRMLWQASTIDWIGIGVLLVAAPAFGSEAARRWVIAVAVLVCAYAAIWNAVVTRGRHAGWCLMLGVVALALMGL